jgi:nucleotide-binding universal stress UspA family protein
MYPNALAMLAMDERDATVIRGLAAAATGLGVERVTLVHVAMKEPLPAGLLAGIHLPDPPPPSALQQAVHDLQQQLPGVEVTGHFAVGAPAEVLEKMIADDDIDLLVMGRAPSKEGEPSWGPHGRHLLRSAACSVLVVPKEAVLGLEHAVVGLDFSRNAGEALKVACGLAERTTAICQYDTAVAASGAITDAEFEAALEKNAREHFERDLAPLLGDLPHPSLHIANGPRASEVLIQAAGNDLLVVGSRGLSRLATMLLGSTAENLAGRSIGPLLIVRRKGEVLGLFEGLVHR